MTIYARSKPFRSGQGFIVYCGRKSKDGRYSCAGNVGWLFDHTPGMPGTRYLRMHEIMFADASGRYRLRPHAQKQRLAGRRVGLRTQRPPDQTPDLGVEHNRNLGRLGERSARGDVIRSGQVRFICPECAAENITPEDWLKARSASC